MFGFGKNNQDGSKGVSDLGVDIELLKCEKECLEDEIKDLKRSNDALKGRCSCLEKINNEKNRAIEKGISDGIKYLAEIDELKERCKILSNKYDNIFKAKAVVQYGYGEGKIRELEEKVCCLEEENQDLRKQNSCLKNTINDNKIKIGNLNRQALQQFATIQEIKERIRFAVAEVKRLEEKVKSLQYDLDSAKCQGQKHQKDAKKYKGLFENSKIRINEYKEMKDDYQRQLNDLKDLVHLDTLAIAISNEVYHFTPRGRSYPFGDLVSTVQEAINRHV